PDVQYRIGLHQLVRERRHAANVGSGLVHHVRIIDAFEESALTFSSRSLGQTPPAGPVPVSLSFTSSLADALCASVAMWSSAYAIEPQASYTYPPGQTSVSSRVSTAPHLAQTRRSSPVI